MKVTAIEPKANQTALYRVVVDGKPLGYVRAEDIIGLDIRVNRDLNRQAYSKLIRQIKYTDCYMKAVKYADLRLRSKSEVEFYLKRHGCDPVIAREITSRMESFGLIDEAKLAAAFIHDAELVKPVSRRLLIAKLKQKGISQDVISANLAESGYDEQSVLDQLIAKKAPYYKDNQSRFFHYLLRQGFNYDAIAKRIGSPVNMGSRLKRSPKAR